MTPQAKSKLAMQRAIGRNPQEVSTRYIAILADTGKCWYGPSTSFRVSFWTTFSSSFRAKRKVKTIKKCGKRKTAATSVSSALNSGVYAPHKYARTAKEETTRGRARESGICMLAPAPHKDRATSIHASSDITTVYRATSIHVACDVSA